MTQFERKLREYSEWLGHELDFIKDKASRQKPKEQARERLVLRPMTMDEYLKGRRIVNQGPTREEQRDIFKRVEQRTI